VAALLHENGNDSERYRQRSQDSHADTKEQIIPHGATISGLTPWGMWQFVPVEGGPSSATQPQLPSPAGTASREMNGAN
jgi:hypothetical protein